jgi:hypothetical protein
LPLETWDDIKFSFEEVFKLFAPELQMGFLKFLKGTPVRDKYAQHGFVFDPEPPYEIIESNYLSREELARLKMVEHALEVYWNKPRATRTLQYVTAQYSIFDFLLGLGACFAEQHTFHQYTLPNVYERLFTFAQRQYPEDTLLQELIDLDFCLYMKERPRPMYLQEVDDTQKAALVEAFQAQLAEPLSGKVRYLALPVRFDWQVLVEEKRVSPGETTLLLVYDGVKAGQVFSAVGMPSELLR